VLEGGELRYRNMRRFGSVRLARDARALERATSNLGPDALDVDNDRFHELLDRRRGSLKAALMNQALIAGLGNLLVDEIAWRARIHPGLPLSRLGRKRRDRLHDCMHAVLRESIPRGRIPPDRDWLTGVRDDRRSGACPRCGTKLRRATIAGRTTVWCPSCQPKR
jgi:formamidopyrimidine-DNA glycosylase